MTPKILARKLDWIGQNWIGQNWSNQDGQNGIGQSRSLLCTRMLHPAAPPDRAAGARTRQPENSKRAHFRAPALQTPPEFHKKRPKEREKRTKNCGGRGKKKNEILGPHHSGPHPTLRGPTLRAPPLFLGLAPHRLEPHHDTKNVGQKIRIGLAKIGLAKIGQIRMAKTGLAKVGLFCAHACCTKCAKRR